ncbi:MAG: hypothetical protein KGH95_08510, partial [Thaumarchaeota archaeon]|nr:hypothetical protein [Nitrososphaerota archaeon]
MKWSFVPTKSGTYSLNVNIDGQFRLGYGFQVTDAHSASNQNLQVVSSPLQQFKSGITANDIKCNQGLQLVIKAEDGSPACVKADTAIVLVNHRWATNVLQPNPMTGLNDDTGIATLKNQAYYFETVNYTDDAYKHPIQISFHDVIFTLFPSGFRGGLPAWGCGGSYY